METRQAAEGEGMSDEPPFFRTSRHFMRLLILRTAANDYQAVRDLYNLGFRGRDLGKQHRFAASPSARKKVAYG